MTAEATCHHGSINAEMLVDTHWAKLDRGVWGSGFSNQNWGRQQSDIKSGFLCLPSSLYALFPLTNFPFSLSSLSLGPCQFFEKYSGIRSFLYPTELACWLFWQLKSYLCVTVDEITFYKKLMDSPLLWEKNLQYFCKGKRLEDHTQNINSDYF